MGYFFKQRHISQIYSQQRVLVATCVFEHHVGSKLSNRKTCEKTSFDKNGTLRVTSTVVVLIVLVSNPFYVL